MSEKLKVEYRFSGSIHNENGPAVIHSDGRKEYWINGKEIKERFWKNEKKRKGCTFS